MKLVFDVARLFIFSHERLLKNKIGTRAYDYSLYFAIFKILCLLLREIQLSCVIIPIYPLIMNQFKTQFLNSKRLYFLIHS